MESDHHGSPQVWCGLQFTATGYSVAGNAFGTGLNGITVNISRAGTAVVTPAVTILGSQPWLTSTVDDTLTLDGQLNLNGQTLTVNGLGLIVVNEGLTGCAASSIMLNATGGLRIPNSGSFAFSGPITVQEGVLEIANGWEFPLINLEDGGVLGGDGHLAAPSPTFRKAPTLPNPMRRSCASLTRAATETMSL